MMEASKKKMEELLRQLELAWSDSEDEGGFVLYNVVLDQENELELTAVLYGTEEEKFWQSFQLLDEVGDKIIYLQDFKKITRFGYSATQVTKVANELKKLPRGSNTRFISLGYDSAADHNREYTSTKVKAKFKLANIKNMILTEGNKKLKAIFFKGIKPELVTELFDNVIED